MEYGQAANRYPQEATEAQRPVANSMTELASCIGDLETASRALAARLKPLLPAGSPFERIEKEAALGQVGTSVPRPVRSFFNEELQSRIYSLGAITQAINEMVKGIEL